MSCLILFEIWIALRSSQIGLGVYLAAVLSFGKVFRILLRRVRIDFGISRVVSGSHFGNQMDILSLFGFGVEFGCWNRDHFGKRALRVGETHGFEGPRTQSVEWMAAGAEAVGEYRGGAIRMILF